MSSAEMELVRSMAGMLFKVVGCDSGLAGGFRVAEASDGWDCDGWMDCVKFFGVASGAKPRSRATIFGA